MIFFSDLRAVTQITTKKNIKKYYLNMSVSCYKKFNRVIVTPVSSFMV